MAKKIDDKKAAIMINFIFSPYLKPVYTKFRARPNQSNCSPSPPLSQLILKTIHLTATREPRRIYTPPVKQFENEGGGLKKRGKYQLTEHCSKWYTNFPDASQCDQYEREPGSDDDT